MLNIIRFFVLYVTTYFFIQKNVRMLVSGFYSSDRETIFGRLQNKICFALLIKNYGIHLGSNASLGHDLFFPHPLGIVIGDGVVVGNSCTIYQNVTLGKKLGDLGAGDYPIICNNVTVFSGAVIVGGVTVSDHAIIGANSVVISDVEAGAVYAGVPAKKVASRCDGGRFNGSK